MKNLIKVFVLVFAVALTSESFAQIGIKAGLNMSNMLQKDDDRNYSKEDDYQFNPGYHLGLTAEIPFSESISLETGLLLNTKGTKLKDKETSGNETYTYVRKLNLMHVDVPFLIKPYFDAGDVRVYALAGPYVSMGIAGKYKYKYTDNNSLEKETYDIEWGTDEYEHDFKRLDFGATLGAGAQMKGVQVGLSYSMGFANTSPYSENGYKSNNRVLALSVGYIFGSN